MYDLERKDDSWEASGACCLECGEKIEYGRHDKKFCSDKCRHAYHNRRESAARLFRSRVVNALNGNYRILSGLMAVGVTSADIKDLVQMGYRTEFVTSYRKVRCHEEFRCFDIKYFQSSNRIFGLSRTPVELKSIRPRKSAPASSVDP